MIVSLSPSRATTKLHQCQQVPDQQLTQLALSLQTASCASGVEAIQCINHGCRGSKLGPPRDVKKEKLTWPFFLRPSRPFCCTFFRRSPPKGCIALGHETKVFQSAFAHSVELMELLGMASSGHPRPRARQLTRHPGHATVGTAYMR